MNQVLRQVQRRSNVEGLAAVYEQDTSNLERQQRGFKASAKKAESLANYQEARIRQVHMTLDKYLKA